MYEKLSKNSTYYAWQHQMKLHIWYCIYAVMKQGLLQDVITRLMEDL